MFLDEVLIKVHGGKGGDGIVAFRREKYVPLGGPAGGNGGRGGSVIFVGEEGINTLGNFRYTRLIKADNGENGKNKNQHGKSAKNTYVKVPLGTVVKTTDGAYIGEITEHNEELVVAHGGRGGRGNTAFKSNKNQAPQFSERGLPGEIRELKLELKMIADVGLIGFPNAGKSTIISIISNAKPKIADYPFTTLTPNLGVVLHNDYDFVVADIPGLIENASLGSGLGFQFLRHIERCRVFVHVVDASSEDPYQNYLTVNNELAKYNEELVNRPQVVVLNKIDLLTEEEINKIKAKFNQDVLLLSAVTKKGLSTFLDKTVEVLQMAPKIILEIPYEELIENKKEELIYNITLDDDGIYSLSGSVIEALFYRTDFSNEASVKRFSYQLRQLQIHERLREAGIKNGDTVKILGYEFEFYD
ncbi:MAG: GTPase ObgE [Acholeplasmataceae bacterium]|jgi:GTP-binding protein|nr:GTPase ObgE [Acholeplasmataceae bacterium]